MEGGEREGNRGCAGGPDLEQSPLLDAAASACAVVRRHASGGAGSRWHASGGPERQGARRNPLEGFRGTPGALLLLWQPRGRAKFMGMDGQTEAGESTGNTEEEITANISVRNLFNRSLA